MTQKFAIMRLCETETHTYISACNEKQHRKVKTHQQVKLHHQNILHPVPVYSSATVATANWVATVAVTATTAFKAPINPPFFFFPLLESGVLGLALGETGLMWGC